MAPVMTRRLWIVTMLVAAWLGLGAFDVAANAMMFGGVVWEFNLPLGAKACLVATGLAALALVLALLLGPVLYLLCPVGRRPAAKVLGSIALLLVAWAIMILDGASWASFRSAAAFADLEGFRLLDAAPLHFLWHVAEMEPGTLDNGLAVTFAFAAFYALAVPWMFRFATPGALRRVNGVAAALLALCTAIGLVGLGTYGRSERPVRIERHIAEFPLGHVYGYDLVRRVNPTLRGLGDAWHLVAPPAPLPEADVRIPVVRRPLMPLDEWAATAATPRRLNVLVILVESLRSDQLSAFGGPREVMPAVEALADESLRYTRAYTQASHSAYADVCPLSSQYPLRYRGFVEYPEEIPYPRVLVYDLLDALGWRTAIVSSQNELWGGMLNYLDTGHVDHLLHAETFDGPRYVHDDDGRFAYWVRTKKRAGKIDDADTVSEAIEWIGPAGADEAPFFAYMNLQNSHVPYHIPPDFPRRFGPPSIDFPLLFGYHPRDKTPIVKDLYADALAYVDVQLARLFDHLRDTGRWEDTIVVLSGDTGQAFYEHGFTSHSCHVYDEVMRVPLMIRVPGTAPRTDATPCEHIDVPPTILDALGLPPHPAFQGRSLLDARRVERPVFLLSQSILSHQLAVVSGRWKLIHDLDWDVWMLYDLLDDPGETTDVAAAHADVVARLRALLNTWRRVQLEYYGDPRACAETYPPTMELVP